MEITRQQIISAVPDVYQPRLDEFVAAWNQFAVHYGVSNGKRAAHLLAQIFVESGGLKHVTENLNYSREGLLKTFRKYFNESNVDMYARNPEKIGNRVYANRMGNGSEGSGDGYRYRGRGFLQLTGKENFTKYKKSDLCIIDCINSPELVSQFPDHTKTALWFWERNGLNAIADKDNGRNGEAIVTEITKKVNGGTNGLNQRKEYYRRFKKVFGL